MTSGVGDAVLKLAVEAAPTGLLMIERTGLIVFVNQRIERMFGWSRDELIGKPVESLVPERFRARHPSSREGFWGDPLTRPMGAGRDLYGLHKDGTEIPVEIGLNPLQIPEGPLVLASIVDITERKRAAEVLEASLREKETLLREVHHRVNNNLQIISSLLGLQSRYVKDPDVAAVLVEAHSRVHSIALVHETLYRSRDLGSVSMEEYFHTLVGQLASTWGTASRIQTVITVPGRIALPVDLAVASGLIVNEVVTNAFKHAFPGERTGNLTVSMLVSSGKAEITVADDGIGMPEEVDIEAPARMGLRLVRTLARQIQAEIVVRRSPGTRFSLMFPLA